MDECHNYVRIEIKIPETYEMILMGLGFYIFILIKNKFLLK